MKSDAGTTPGLGTVADVPRRVVIENVSPEIDGGGFPVTSLGKTVHTLAAWVDRFRSWGRDLAKKADAGQDDVGSP